MIITTIEELRLASPAHAIDSIDGLVGFIDNSEHDFLEDKLGTPLYEALCKWYDSNPASRSTVADYRTGYWNRLLLLAQRVVAFDALERYAGVQGVSLNNAGINQMVAEDYPKADRNTVSDYRATCVKEAHISLNLMLRKLEQWCKENNENAERHEIVTKWKQSRYYYLAATLLIPSCEVLQSYLNIYDNREKFIQLLPDLQFIQEEQITTSVGNDLMTALIAFSTTGTKPDDVQEDLLHVVIHRLRKIMAALLAGRTSVLKYTKEQKVQFHDDGVRLFEVAINHLRNHQQGFPEELIKNAPWYIAPQETAPAPVQKKDCICAESKAGPACWTPPLF